MTPEQALNISKELALSKSDLFKGVPQAEIARIAPFFNVLQAEACTDLFNIWAFKKLRNNFFVLSEGEILLGTWPDLKPLNQAEAFFGQGLDYYGDPPDQLVAKTPVHSGAIILAIHLSSFGILRDIPEVADNIKLIKDTRYPKLQPGSRRLRLST